MMSSRVLFLPFCALLCATAACFDAGGPRAGSAEPATTSGRVPIELASDVVILRDPARRASAFQEGLVGRPPAKGGASAATLFAPHVFLGPGLTQAESDQMAASFDWAHTDPVAVTIPGGETALYSMNILIKSVDDLYGLRGLGIHTQTQPIFPVEQDVWDGKLMKAMAQGEPVGAWIAAIVPGPVYNDIRSQALEGIANGTPIGIDAMVFRKIHQPGAAVYPDPSVLVSPIDPTYIGEQGIEFNGYSAVQCEYDPDIGANVCTIEQGLFGWLLNKIITIVVDIYEAVVDAVRQMIGAVVKLVKGEVDVTVGLVLRNSDGAFDTAEPARSGWNGGAPLALKDLTVRVYQGVAEFTGTTDENGVATVSIAKDRSARVCIDLENDRVVVVDTFTERRICFDQRVAGTSTPVTVALSTNDEHANLLAAITDAGDYLETVMGFDMNRVSVVTGWQSSLLTSLNDGRSFAPCMGRMPNLSANIAIYSAGVVTPLLTALGELAEFLVAYDIVLDEGDVAARGVGVHEYGHAAMCELMRRADQAKASLAWADVIVASMTGQDPGHEQSMIAEGFADFLALQVVGGTNYFSGLNTRTVGSMDYCKGDSLTANQCVEPNSQRCSGAGCDKRTNIRYAASVLQDVFDRIPVDLADRANPSVLLPNDGSHWLDDGTRLVPHHAANQTSSTDKDTIQLAGPALASVFTSWSSRGSTLSYHTFFGGVAQTLKDQGFDVTAVCNLFAAHETGGQCPDYVIEVFGGPPPAGNPPPPVDRFAYALADQPAAADYEPDAVYSHSGATSAIRIRRTTAGRYRVTFDALPASGPGLAASVAVTAFGSAPITCSAGNLATVNGAGVVDVVCWDHAQGAPADTRFSILFVGNDGLLSPSSFLASGGDPVPPLDPQLNWTSGRWPQSVTHGSGVGSYLLNHGVGNAAFSAKLVTARGTAGGERCNNANLISGGHEVRCFDRTGAPAEGSFNAVQVATGKPGRRFGLAFVYIVSTPSSLPHPQASYNSSGGPITVTRTSVGQYIVDFAGLQKDIGHTENVQVTALSGLPRTCHVASLSNSPTGLAVGVECRQATTFADTRFQVAVVE